MTRPHMQPGSTTAKPWLNGKPYYCQTCGLGMAEYLACEDGCCELESETQAQLRASKEPQP